MDIYQGTPIFNGIAIGTMKVYSRAQFTADRTKTSNPQKEMEAFEKARRLALLNIRNEEERKVLNGESLAAAVRDMIETEKVTALFAVTTIRQDMIDKFGRGDIKTIRSWIHALDAACTRLIALLTEPLEKISLGKKPVILVTDSLLPADIMEIPREMLLGIVTCIGSSISHTAILSRNMGIPYLSGIEPDAAWDGETAVLDGYAGKLYVHPDNELVKECLIRRKVASEEQESLLTLRNAANVTSDGRRMDVMANIVNLDDLSSALYYGAAGIGLLRSEFQYLGVEESPGEDELYLSYRKAAEMMGDKLVCIRTADLGLDKNPLYLKLPHEENPLMGNRGIRLSLDEKQLFRTQLRAIYRASSYGNLAVMFPMLSSMAELDAILATLHQVREGLEKRGIPFREIPVGIMIETPAAVMISDDLARKVDFLSLGTNDLTQYTLAMDRQNPSLLLKYDDHHEAVLRMISLVVKNGHSQGCRVGICGELAADTSLTGQFLDMGVDFLSVVPACILDVRKAIREIEPKKG